MPWEWAIDHMIAGVTAPPRWQWSSANGILRDSCEATPGEYRARRPRGPPLGTPRRSAASAVRYAPFDDRANSGEGERGRRCPNMEESQMRSYPRLAAIAAAALFVVGACSGTASP